MTIVLGGDSMAKSESARLQWARIGAEARLRELEEERASILAAFPELRGSGRVGARQTGGKRRTMSAAARRRMSAGMRKYWARRKALQKKVKGAA
jgi:hypothetical protein